MEETRGFEPLERITRPSIFKTDALSLSATFPYMEEMVRFELTGQFTCPSVFETDAINQALPHLRYGG